MDIVTGLMKLDYFLGHKYKPRKIWWDDVLDKADWAKYMKQIADQPERVSAKLAEAGLSERELQKFIVLDELPFRLAPVLESISGLRYDGELAAEVELDGTSEGSVSVGVGGQKLHSAVTATASVEREGAGVCSVVAAETDLLPSVAAVADGVPAAPLNDPHPGASEGRTLLVVLYQQDESQRAQYYALSL